MEDQFEDQQPLPNTHSFVESTATVAKDKDCFECNICLEFAVDPVVTLCGHLYCWPCMHKWLEIKTTTPQQCPVCKATLSETALVPLYGRGNITEKKSISIPRRPATHHCGQTSSSITPSLGHHHRRSHHRSMSQPYDYANREETSNLQGVSQLLASAVVVVLSWVFGEQISTGLEFSERYYLVSEESGPTQRRQEILAQRYLHRVFVFMFCCMVLCLLLF